MRVLVAFDKFKDSLTASEACDIAAHTLRGRHPDWTFDRCPLADGGEGFCEILTRAVEGHTIASTVTDPLGDPVQAHVGFVPLDRIPTAARTLLALPATAPGAPPPNRTPTLAIIEMASASGLALLELNERNPWQTSSTGTGELVRTAAELGVAGILLGVGGSATNDLGLGALAALGLEFRTADRQLVDPPIPHEWRQIAEITGRLPATLPPIRIACDVTNPLLGPNGATAIYGPQKGLRPADVTRLDHECARLAMMLCTHAGKPDTLMQTPGTGAAGGISFGLMAVANARLLPGFELVSSWLDLEKRIASADLVLTGEGRFDDSSLSGKGPGAVAARALALGRTVHVFAGEATVAQPPPGLSVHPITRSGTALSVALLTSRQNLVSALGRVFG
ncbi:MAG: glycerate kinase [Opitutaceae bacterium]|nr:glycerate kinase [Opitutaceae bacterium]